MKKILCIVMVLLAVLLIFTGCSNRQLIDTTYRYDYAIIKLANGEVVEGKVQSWLDFENSDMIQVKIDGKSYLVHSVNCDLIDQ